MPFSIIENGIIISKNEKVEYPMLIFIIMPIQLITNQLLL